MSSRWLLLFMGILLGACKGRAAPTPSASPSYSITQEDRDLLDRLKAKERMRADLEASPSRYVHSGGWEKYDKGIINSYTRATAIEFTNESEFDVSGVKGKITFLSTGGQELGTVPFTAVGELPARSKSSLQVTTGEISGDASRARVLVERVRIRG